MPNDNNLINLGDLSKPANTFIEKISDAVGGIAAPWQTRRMAKAEADAAITRAQANITISELEKRAIERMFKEEGYKQENMENITLKAIPKLNQSANPENMEKDWLTYFFEKSRLTSDEEMQTLWANILAGEANTPGSFSKRSVGLVATLSKNDAELFTKLCTFCWKTDEFVPLIFDSNNIIYNKLDINFTTLMYLDDIGLIKFQPSEKMALVELPKCIVISYQGVKISIEFPHNENKLMIGCVILTQAGQELANICSSKRDDEYYYYVIERWKKEQYKLTALLT